VLARKSEAVSIIAGPGNTKMAATLLSEKTVHALDFKEGCLIILNSWIIGKIACWIMVALIAIVVNQLLEKYRHDGMNRETAITIITAIGILALFVWLIIGMRYH
jgi:hypothetical protein